MKYELRYDAHYFQPSLMKSRYHENVRLILMLCSSAKLMNLVNVSTEQIVIQPDLSALLEPRVALRLSKYIYLYRERLLILL